MVQVRLFLIFAMSVLAVSFARAEESPGSARQEAAALCQKQNEDKVQIVEEKYSAAAVEAFPVGTTLKLRTRVVFKERETCKSAEKVKSTKGMLLAERWGMHSCQVCRPERGVERTLQASAKRKVESVRPIKDGILGTVKGYELELTEAEQNLQLKCLCAQSKDGVFSCPTSGGLHALTTALSELYADVEFPCDFFTAQKAATQPARSGSGKAR